MYEVRCTMYDLESERALRGEAVAARTLPMYDVAISKNSSSGGSV